MNSHNNQYSRPNSSALNSRLTRNINKQSKSPKQLQPRKVLGSPKMRKFFDIGPRPAKKQKQKYLVWVPEKFLFSRLNLLNGSFPKKFMICQKIMESENPGKLKAQQKQYLWIITTMDAFTDTFIILKQKIGLECKKWIIMSSAINSKVTQEHFNEIHKPINFIFVPNLPAICNSLANYQPGLSSKKITGIVGLMDTNIGHDDQKILSLEYKNSTGIKLKSSQIYIVEDLKKYQKIGLEKVYFLEGRESFRGLELRLHYDINECPIVLLGEQMKLEDIPHFSEFQQEFQQKYITPEFVLDKALNSTPQYIQKFLRNFLIPYQKTCFFYPQHSEHQKWIKLSNIFKQKNQVIYLLSSDFYIKTFNSYLLRSSALVNSINDLGLSHRTNYEGQVDRIIEFIELRQKMKDGFMRRSEILKKVSILLYMKEGQDGNHLISQILGEIKIKVQIIESLDHMYQSHKITIVYGRMNFNEIKSLADFQNVFIHPLQYKSQENAPFCQVSEAQEFMKIIENAYNQFYGTQKQQLVEAVFDIVYDSPENVQKIKASINVPENMVNTIKISYFKEAVSKFRDYTQHLIFLEMEEFSENIETIIKDVQWNPASTLSLEVYLAYSQQFILRTKDNSFKFLKNDEFKKKISQVIENYSNVPKPMPQTPLPYMDAAEQLTDRDLDEHHEQNIDPNPQNQQAYKLYLCVHRSIPFHSLRRRKKKQYILLVYNRIQEIIVFSHFLKKQENIMVIANKNSETIYAQVVNKYPHLKDRVQFTYCGDLGENYIRKQIDQILMEMKIKMDSDLESNQQILQRFIPVLLYNGFNQKASKGIKLIRKIFNHRLNVLIMKNAEFEELIDHHLKFKLHQQTRVFCLGSSNDKQAIPIKSMKGIWMLAMNPDIKSFYHTYSDFIFPLKLYVGRLLYSDGPKNYEVVSKTKKDPKTLLKIKSSKLLLCKDTQTHSGRTSASKTPRNLSSFKSSSLLKLNSTLKVNSTLKQPKQPDTKTSIILLDGLASHYKCQQHFSQQSDLYRHIMKNQNFSQLSIVILSQQQFQFYQIFQCQTLHEKYPDIIWMVCTDKKSKKVFIAPTLIFIEKQSIAESVDNVIKQYNIWQSFNECRVQDPDHLLKNGYQKVYRRKWDEQRYGYSLKICRQKDQISRIENPNILYLCLNPQKSNKEESNCIYFSNLQQLHKLMDSLTLAFTQSPTNTPLIGSIIFNPQSMNPKTKNTLQTEKYSPNTIIKQYKSPRNLIQYSILRVLVLYFETNPRYPSQTSRQNSSQLYGCLSNSVTIPESKEKLCKIIQHLLLA